MTAIPTIDIAPLYGTDVAARDAVDEAIGNACRGAGFLVVTGQPSAARLDQAGRRHRRCPGRSPRRRAAPPRTTPDAAR